MNNKKITRQSISHYNEMFNSENGFDLMQIAYMSESTFNHFYLHMTTDDFKSFLKALKLSLPTPSSNSSLPNQRFVRNEMLLIKNRLIDLVKDQDQKSKLFNSFNDSLIIQEVFQ
jgi:hypothetical protein